MPCGPLGRTRACPARLASGTGFWRRSLADGAPTTHRHADLDYAHPRHKDRVGTASPELRVVMAHMGHPWWIDTITVIRKHPNIYADVSALFYRPWSQWECFRYATEWSTLHKMLFATDFPVASVEETIAGLRRVNAPVESTGLPRVPEEKIEEIIHRDSLGLLGLERPAAVARR